MILDYFLSLVIIVSGGYLVYLVIRKLPQLSNINVDRIPGARDAAVKNKILEAKLKRDIVQRFTALQKFFGWQKLSLRGIMQSWQDRLLQLEREYKRITHRDLSSEVKKSKVLEDLLGNAKTYLSQDEYGKAEEVLIDALALNDHHRETYFLLVRAYQGKRELDHAKETLEYLLRLTHHEDPKVYQGLAEISAERGNLKEAEEDYLRSISLDENNYVYYLQLADIYKDLEELDKALEAAKKSLILAPNNPKILDFLVEISILLQDREQANDYLDRLLEVNPDNNKIDVLRKKIETL
jgi:tetratricopeptide (TPR) repeat protein